MFLTLSNSLLNFWRRYLSEGLANWLRGSVFGPLELVFRCALVRDPRLSSILLFLFYIIFSVFLLIFGLKSYLYSFESNFWLEALLETVVVGAGPEDGGLYLLRLVGCLSLDLAVIGYCCSLTSSRFDLAIASWSRCISSLSWRCCRSCIDFLLSFGTFAFILCSSSRSWAFLSSSLALFCCRNLF